MAGTLITPSFLLCFPRIWKASSPGGTGEPSFGCTALFPEPALDTPEWKEIQAEIAEVGKEKFGASVFNKDFVQKLKDKDRLCVKDAGEKSGEWSGFEPGRKYINMKRREEDGRPEVVDLNFNDILDESLVYAGVVVRAGVRFYAYDNKWGQGVSCSLDHIQLIKTGTPRLDGRQSAKQVFSKGTDPSASAEAVLKDMGIESSQSADENNGEDLGV